MRFRGFLLAVAAMPVFAQSGVTRPQLGFVVDDGRLVPVWGVAGAFGVDHAITSAVYEAAFSGRLGVGRTGWGAFLFDAGGRVIAEWRNAPEGPLLVAFSPDRARTWIWSSGSRQLWTWREATDPEEARVPDFEGEVVSIAAPEDAVMFALVRRGDEYWRVRFAPGAAFTAEELPLSGVPGAATLTSAGDLISIDCGRAAILVRDTAIPLPGAACPERLVYMGEGWLHATGPGASFAVRLIRGAEAIFALPRGRP